jgi:hypothetical protein
MSTAASSKEKLAAYVAIYTEGEKSFAKSQPLAKPQSTVKGNGSTLDPTPKQTLKEQTLFFGRGVSKVKPEQTHHWVPLDSRHIGVVGVSLFCITTIFVVAIWSLVELDSTMNLIRSWIAYSCNLFATIGTIMQYILAIITIFLVLQFVLYMDHLIYRLGVCVLMAIFFLWNLMTSVMKEGFLEFQSQGPFILSISCSMMLFFLHQMITLPKEDKNHRDFHEKRMEMQEQLYTIASTFVNITGWFGGIISQVTLMLRNLKGLLPGLIGPFVESCTSLSVSLAPGIVAICMRAQSLVYAHPYIAGVAAAITCGFSFYLFWSSKEEMRAMQRKILRTL